MNRKKLQFTLTALAILSAFIASSARSQVAKIRLGTHVSLYYYTFFTERPDLLKNYGKSYEVDWVVFRGGGEAMPALASNNVDGTFISPFPFANAIMKAKLDLTAVHQVVSMGEKGHYGDTWIVRDDGLINSPKDLKGRIIGVNAIGSTSEMGVRILLGRYGYEAGKDFTIVEGRPPHLPSMLKDKKIDCAVVFQPFYSAAHMKGGIKDLASTVDIYGGPQDYLFVVFKTDFIKKHSQAIRDYLEDYLHVLKWARTNRLEAADIYAKKWKLDGELVRSFLLTEKDYYSRPDGRIIPSKIQIVVDTLYENGFLDQRLDLYTYIDNSYLPRVVD